MDVPPSKPRDPRSATKKQPAEGDDDQAPNHAQELHHTLADASVLADPSLLDLDGPALFGIADRAGTTREGYSAEEYLRESIVLPAEFLAEGYVVTVMPRNFGEKLDAQGLADLIAFLMTQSG